MARKRGKRFERGTGDQRQLEEIEKAQQAARRKQAKQVIDSIEKSKQRLRNRFKRIRDADDASKEFGGEGDTGATSQAPG